mmetsp:Transcript_23296/g.72887  ORF Transcript_23296/g.72887 Transcript_23296/m.72887 type:complete len:205 (-) Transcript_23296:973-1587(-)
MCFGGTFLRAENAAVLLREVWQRDRAGEVDLVVAFRALADEVVRVPAVLPDIEHLPADDGLLAVATRLGVRKLLLPLLLHAINAEHATIGLESCADRATLTDLDCVRAALTAEAALVPGSTVERYHLLAGVERLVAALAAGHVLVVGAELLLERFAHVVLAPDLPLVEERFHVLIEHVAADVAAEAILVPPVLPGHARAAAVRI